MGLEKAQKYIGMRIHAERRKRKLTQGQLALVAKVGEKVIGQIENYKGNPTLKTLDKIAKAFDLEIEDICPTQKGFITIDYEALKNFRRG